VRDAEWRDLLFPQVDGLVIQDITLADERVVVAARVAAAHATYPECGEASGRVHSGYDRRLADAAVGGRPVVIRLRVRRFRCAAAACPKTTFAEQVAGQRSPRPAVPGCVLPAWAIDKIRTDFVGHPEHLPVSLLKIAIRDMAPGVDPHIPATAFTTHPTNEDAPKRMRILLAELHPDALPVPGEPMAPATDDMLGTTQEGWPGFFHRAHRLLPDDGYLLLATRQRRDSGRLTDPLGALIAVARTAGFRYLQHIVVAYAHLDGDQLVPAPPSDASQGVTHCDLIALGVIRHA
jgi:hypothetical protein